MPTTRKISKRRKFDRNIYELSFCIFCRYRSSLSGSYRGNISYHRSFPPQDVRLKSKETLKRRVSKEFILKIIFSPLILLLYLLTSKPSANIGIFDNTSEMAFYFQLICRGFSAQEIKNSRAKLLEI